MTFTNTTKNRLFPRAAATAAVAGAFVLTAPLAASAHVGVSPDAIPDDASTVVTFSFTHGCGTSPTTGLRITMPEGLAQVSPTVDPAWDIAVERADNGLVSAVTYTATTPVPSDLRGAVTMAIRPGEDAPERFVFPVEQTCVDGSESWTDVAEDGQDPHDLDAPAPVVALTSGDGETHGGTHGSGDGDGDGAADAAHGDTADGTAAPAPLVTALSVTGLVVSLGALIVAVLGWRRAAPRG